MRIRLPPSDQCSRITSYIPRSTRRLVETDGRSINAERTSWRWRSMVKNWRGFSGSTSWAILPSHQSLETALSPDQRSITDSEEMIPNLANCVIIFLRPPA